MIKEAFDFQRELERAAKQHKNDVRLPFVDINRSGIFPTLIGDFIPCVWGVEGAYVAGFITDKLICTVFIDWPIANLAEAKHRANQFAADAAKLSP